MRSPAEALHYFYSYVQHLEKLAIGLLIEPGMFFSDEFPGRGMVWGIGHVYSRALICLEATCFPQIIECWDSHHQSLLGAPNAVFSKLPPAVPWMSVTDRSSHLELTHFCGRDLRTFTCSLRRGEQRKGVEAGFRECFPGHSPGHVLHWTMGPGEDPVPASMFSQNRVHSERWTGQQMFLHLKVIRVEVGSTRHLGVTV